MNDMAHFDKCSGKSGREHDDGTPLPTPLSYVVKGRIRTGTASAATPVNVAKPVTRSGGRARLGQMLHLSK